jgi:2-succinyl-5-enolpyruvyl-6-hydroxy-3-cyclohexene-1-carboxylate synthase
MNFAQLIIKSLINQNAGPFFLAPGSRSTPLAVAIAKQKGVKCYIHFDERGLAFYALGFAKVAQQPAVIVVTSGTAVGNLLPAVMEAANAHIPLILLTADRPFELRDCGANQTTDQVKLFSNFVRWQTDLPASDPAIEEHTISQNLSHAIACSRWPSPGPVHINCSFRKPFLPLSTHHGIELQQILPIALPSNKEVESIAKIIQNKPRGLLIAGSGAFASSATDLTTLAKHLQWPILTDPLSQIRANSPRHHLIPYFNHLLNDDLIPQCDAILHFGDRLVSETLQSWIQAHPPSFYGLINAHPSNHNPTHCLTHRIYANPTAFCQTLKQHLSVAKQTSWIQKWKENSKTIQIKMAKSFQSIKGISEPKLFHFLQHALPSNWALFVGNSMPIRDADSFFFPKRPPAALMANRGVSGIDGNIATACGVAEALQTPLLAVLGDQTLLHDLNSLALITKEKTPKILIVCNNGGGGIFSFLPISKEKKLLEKYFSAAHPLSFESAAKMFSIPYLLCQSTQQLETTLRSVFKTPKHFLVEIQTNRDENVLQHKQLFFQKTTKESTF